MKKLLLLVLIFATTMAFGMSIKEVNKASKEELMKINGIGSKKADAIINHRKKTPFKSFDDIESVKGIGPSLTKNIKNDVLVKQSSKKSSKKSTTDKKKKSSNKKEKSSNK